MYEDDDYPSSEDEADPRAPKLPFGIKKVVLDSPPPDSVDRPQEGDEVSVHLVANLLDGTELQSSRTEGTPFNFVLGKRPLEVILGLELGVYTMKRGEVSKFTIAPRFAYEDMGYGKLIPPDATVVFEVELLDWKPDWKIDVDLFGDGRAIKTATKKGFGKVNPKINDEVIVSVTVTGNSGNILEEYKQIAHRCGCGSQDFGSLSRIVTEALKTMIEGETAKVSLRRFAIDDTLIQSRYASSTMDITIETFFETMDVSPRRDGIIIKKRLRRGANSAFPKQGCVVRVLVDSLKVDGKEHSEFNGPKELEFIVGDGDVCDALEFSVLGMTCNERAEVTCNCSSQRLLCLEPLLGIANMKGTFAVLTLDLQSCSESNDVSVLPLRERLHLAGMRKTKATEMFKQQRFLLALTMYDWILALFTQSDTDNDLEKLRSVCELNRAACLLKIDAYNDAILACDKVLSTEPHHVKAKYRRATAHLSLSNYSAAQRDALAVLECEPRNAEARNLLVQVREAKKLYAQQAKTTAGRMIIGEGFADASNGAALTKEMVNTPADSKYPQDRVMSKLFSCFSWCKEL